MVVNQPIHVSIRQFELADLPQMVAIEHAVYGSGAYSRYFFRQLYDLAPSLLWVAVDDASGKLAGHVCGALGEGCTVGWILNAAVLAHYRRQGIGRRLVERSLAQFAALHVDCIRVTSEVENTAANRMYESLGFYRVRIEANYYFDSIDRLIFEFRSPAP